MELFNLTNKPSTDDIIEEIIKSKEIMERFTRLIQDKDVSHDELQRQLSESIKNVCPEGDVEEIMKQLMNVPISCNAPLRPTVEFN